MPSRRRSCARIHKLVAQSLPAYLEDLASLVNIDCGSYTKAGVDRVGRWTARFLERLGATVDQPRRTRSWATRSSASIEGRTGGPRLLLIGHLDTVFPEGTVAERPYRVEAGRAYGPGVTDMKSGLLTGLYGLLALRALAESDPTPARRPSAGCRSSGSCSWRTRTRRSDRRRRARSSAISRATWTCASSSSARGPTATSCRRARGSSICGSTSQGRAAHAGVEPEKGRSAILEAAHHVVALHALNGRWPGVTCNVGVDRGRHAPERRRGTGGAAGGPAFPDARGTRGGRGGDPGPDRPADGSRRRRDDRGDEPPLADGTAARRGALVAQAQALAARLGFEVRDAATGGASDANTTAGMGVPTLDGLGPIGGNDHAPSEYLELDSIVPRTTLLAALLLARPRPVVGGWRPPSAGPRSASAPVHLVGRAVGGGRRLQPRGRGADSCDRSGPQARVGGGLHGRCQTSVRPRHRRGGLVEPSASSDGSTPSAQADRRARALPPRRPPPRAAQPQPSPIARRPAATTHGRPAGRAAAPGARRRARRRRRPRATPRRRAGTARRRAGSRRRSTPPRASRARRARRVAGIQGLAGAAAPFRA